MASYTAPIPAAIFEQVPKVVRNHPGGTFDVRIEAFPDDDDGQMFSIDVWTDAERIEPTDRRQKPYTQAKRWSYFFNAEGGSDGEPQVGTTRYR
jgi:hypothetical protein